MTDTLTLTNYQTRLPTFEGPLDVLLRLIERQKLDITEVSLVAVTDQFLEHLATLEEQLPEVVAEFTTVGTRLTVLKSRSLLPRPPVIEPSDEPDPSDLVEQLRAYKRLKDVAVQLGQRRDAGYATYGHRGNGPVAKVADSGPVRLMRYDAAVLVNAVKRRLSVVATPLQTIRARRIVSIRELSERVLNLVSDGTRVPFMDVVKGSESRTETATAFLAVLVLVRRRVIDATQGALFGDIDLMKTQAEVGDVDAASVDDEFVN